MEENTDPMTTNEDKKEAVEEERGERSKDEDTDEEEEGEEEQDSKKEQVLVIKNAWKDLADTAAAFPAQLNMDECPPLRGYEGTPKCGLICFVSMIKLTFLKCLVLFLSVLTIRGLSRIPYLNFFPSRIRIFYIPDPHLRI